MKLKILLLIVLWGELLCGCESSLILETKPWHTSPSADPRSSTLYPYAEWKSIQKIKVGMTIKKVKTLGHDLQSYEHPVNAIIFTEHNGKEYEVALKLSENLNQIVDVSYKPRG